MAVLIGHASISEKGTNNGVVGDQTGQEVCTRSWYNKGWNVMLICSDKELAKRAAQEMRYACANNNIGYGQDNRTSAYVSGTKNGNTFKNATGNTDCSQLVAGCYIFAGQTSLSPHCTTSSLRAALLATGKFKAYTDAAHLNSDAYAEVGALYLKEGSHVVMALENGSSGGSGGTTNPPVSEASRNAVRTGQAHANNFVGANLKLDGDRGPATIIAGVKVLQHAMNMEFNAGLAVDGSAGSATKAALNGHAVRLGETRFMVTALKILLFLRGYDSGVVGCPQMLDYPGHDALKSYQKDAGLAVDGIAGYNTYMSLIA
ncbi:MAG TPA: peptidoglycan-binding protein [Candidatus Pelethocola excrementipullorum]|nr:peptidoglycan-binding protein [Candidatus Pelethocola excrementipullorum]